MQFSLEKKTRKKNSFIQPIMSIDGLCYKMGNRSIYAIRIFLIRLKMLILQQRKNSWDEFIRKNG